MFAYFYEFIVSDFLFQFCALAGSGMLFVQLLISIFGMGHHETFDHADASHEQLEDPRKFKWLSIQAMTGFLMMFGWTALTCKHEFGLQDTMIISISLASGLFSAWLIRSVFRLAEKLKSTGTVYNIDDAIGLEAYVYQRIPKGGKGKVSVSLQNFTHEIDAISYHFEDVPSFARVKIIQKSDDHTVVVALI